MPTDTCTPLPSDKLNEFITRFHEGPSKFRVSPGWVAIIVWVILTACYGAGYYFLNKDTFTNEDEKTDTQFSKTLAEGLVGYFVLILPLCLIVYIWRMFTWSNMGYQLYYPNETWHGGVFWGSATLVVMIGIVVGLIFIRRWENASLSVFWIFALIVMVILVSVVVGTLAHILIQCKFTADQKYKSLYNCAQEQVLKHVVDVKLAAEQQKQTALQMQENAKTMLKNAETVQNAFTTNATRDVSAASRLIKNQPELVGKEVSRAADSQSRQASSSSSSGRSNLFTPSVIGSPSSSLPPLSDGWF
jgi:flagellar basal body-associated protein FliL